MIVSILCLPFSSTDNLEIDFFMISFTLGILSILLLEFFPCMGFHHTILDFISVRRMCRKICSSMERGIPFGNLRDSFLDV